MKKYICILFVLITHNVFSQGNLTTNTAYGYSYMVGTFTVPVLPGYPLTFHSVLWAGEGSSMCLGGDGKFYLTTRDNDLYEFHPLTYIVGLQSIDVTGLQPGDNIWGIAYNYMNNKYYLSTRNNDNISNIYTVNITTGVATLVGPAGTEDALLDLTIDCEGNCYSFDGSNAYKIDLNTGSATLLGPIGVQLNGDEGMDFDRENGIVYLTAGGGLRQLDTVTGMTHLVADWGYNWVAPFAIATRCYTDCTLDAPVDPYPPSGSFSVSTALDSLRWENDPDATDIQVYFGKIENLHLVYDGPVITSFPVPSLEENALYNWRIKSSNGSCSRYGSAWMFGTIENPEVDCLFEDDFENGLGNWTIVNNSGYCDWEIFQPPYPNNYVMPPSSSGGVFAADGDNCGPQTSILSTAIINQDFDFSSYSWVWLEFDSDWKNVSLQNHAIIDVSTNNGSTWTTIWNQQGNEIRTSVEIVDVSLKCSGKSNVKFRFHSDQYNWGWWWIIDNLKIYGVTCPTCTPRSPTNLGAYHIYPPYVGLYWWDNSYNEEGFSIERKLGDSLSSNQFEVIGTTSQNITTFRDSTVSLFNEYTYRVSGFNENGYSGYSNCVTVVVTNVPVELTSFTASVNGKEIILNWTTATELNNRGFEIQRSTEGVEFLTVGFVKGHGTTTEQHNYSYADNNPTNGKYYYRLKQVDYDGSYEYSDIVDVELRAFNSYLLEQNWPNPFNPTTTIGFGIQNKSNVKITVLNVIGEEVAVIVNEEKEAGYHQVEFRAAALPSGVYFYRIQAGNFIQTKKMILLK